MIIATVMIPDGFPSEQWHTITIVLISEPYAYGLNADGSVVSLDFEFN